MTLSNRDAQVELCDVGLVEKMQKSVQQDATRKQACGVLADASLCQHLALVVSSHQRQFLQVVSFRIDVLTVYFADKGLLADRNRHHSPDRF